MPLQARRSERLNTSKDSSNMSSKASSTDTSNMSSKASTEENLNSATKNANTSNEDILHMLIKMNDTLDNLAKGQSALEVKLSNIEEKLSVHEKSITDLEVNANFTSNEVEDLKCKTTIIQKDSVALNEQLISMKVELENLQRHSRSFNLRFIGVAEAPKDQREDCIQVIKDLVKTTVGMNVDIENAHRTGMKSSKPRHIIARFLRRPERYNVLMKRKSFSDKKIIVVEDLIQSDLQSRRHLAIHARQAWECGKKVRFSKGTLYINNVKFIHPDKESEHEANKDSM